MGAPANRGLRPRAHSHLFRVHDRRARRADRRIGDRGAVAAAGDRFDERRRGLTTRAGWDRSSSPTIADVNGDGRNDIVIGHQNGLLHVINARDRSRPRGLAAADGNRDRQHAGGRRPLQATAKRRSSWGSARRGCRISRVASRSTTPTARCTASSALRDYFNIWTATGTRTATPTACTRRPRSATSTATATPTSCSGASTSTSTRSTATATRS